MATEIKGYIVPNDDKEIYNWCGYSVTCPNDIRSALAEAKGKPVDIEISTCYGGDIDAGSEIYSMLRDYKGGGLNRVTGLAASAASLIAVSRYCEMSPTARMMVHRVSTMSGGNYHDMDKTSEMLQQADKSIAAAYMAKSGMGEKEALQMMDNETWLTAQQAADLKLIDKVMFADESPQLVAGLGMPLPHAVIEKIRTMLAENKKAIQNSGEPKDDKKSDKEKLLLTIDLI